MPATRRARPVGSLLNQDATGLSALLARAAQLEALNQRFLKHLPQELRPHCRLADLQRDTLVFTTTSSVWAARLRYLIPTLLAIARDLDAPSPPQSVRIRVVPRDLPAKAKTAMPLRITEPTAAGLRSAALALDDADLRDALLRLAERAKL